MCDYLHQYFSYPNSIWFRTGEGEMFCQRPESITDVDGSSLSEEEGKFIDTYRKLTTPNQEVAKAMVDALLKTQGVPTIEETSPETRETPGIGPRLEDGKTS
jgi:hypothetical protein